RDDESPRDSGTVLEKAISESSPEGVSPAANRPEHSVCSDSINTFRMLSAYGTPWSRVHLSGSSVCSKRISEPSDWMFLNGWPVFLNDSPDLRIKGTTSSCNFFLRSLTIRRSNMAARELCTTNHPSTRTPSKG